mgnify:CR=1 FL=1
MKGLKYIYISFLAFAIVITFLQFASIISHYLPNYTFLGQNPQTLGFYNFWVDALGTIASFSMVFITAVALSQNEHQLKELKRQWTEEHQPYLSCQLINSENHFKLRITNSSQVVAKNVSVRVENHLKAIHLENTSIFRFEDLQNFLSNQLFIIPPNESIYFDIYITTYKDIENLPQGSIEVRLKCDEKDFRVYNLYPCQHAFMSFDKDNT